MKHALSGRGRRLRHARREPTVPAGAGRAVGREAPVGPPETARGAATWRWSAPRARSRAEFSDTRSECFASAVASAGAGYESRHDAPATPPPGSAIQKLRTV